jgi:hypothetical protein
MAQAGYGDLIWEEHGNQIDNVESVGLVYGVPGGLPMLGTARSGRGDPYEPAHRAWPGPAPAAWIMDNAYSPPTNPGSTPSATSLCAFDLERHRTCRGEPSCALGIQHAAYALGAPPDWVRLDQFELGKALLKRCVARTVGPYMNDVGN